jgi:hypothetical protein
MKETKGYQMPSVGVGDIVLWYPDGDVSLPPCPAIVTARYPRSIAVSIASPNNYNFWLRDSVRHKDDPDTVDEEMVREGVWDYTHDKKTLDSLVKELLGRQYKTAPDAAQPAPSVVGKVGKG